MRIHNIGLFLYSSIAIVALTLVWGFHQIPKTGELAEEQLRVSLEQELTVIRGAVHAATNSVRLRMIDALRGDAETNGHALDDSPLAAAALLDTDQNQWKVTNIVTKRPKELSAEAFKTWIAAWPIDRLTGDQAYFTKVGEYDGRAYFGVAMRVRREADTTAIAVGVLPAAEFPLTLGADRSREVSVFDTSGTALSLNRSAYIGASIRRQPLVSEMLESDTVNVRTDWTNERGHAMFGLATRVADSNLYAAVEARTPLAKATARNLWAFLAMGAFGAILCNWALFAGQIRPLLRQLANAESQVETLRRLMSEAPKVATPTMTDEPIAATELPQLDFVETPAEVAKPPAAVAAVPTTPMAHVIDRALRALEPKLRELEVTVDRVGLDDVGVVSDVLQLQTVIEEVIKNSIEALADSSRRHLTIAAFELDGRITLTIEDSGPGVPKDSLPRIFEPFFTTRPQRSGVARGLGLNVVRRIVEELGGSVIARNLPDGQGFAAELAWPRERRATIEAAAGATVESAAPRAAAPRPAPIARQPMPSDLDLIFDADDEPEHFSAGPRTTAHVDIRRPRVRTLE